MTRISPLPDITLNCVETGQFKTGVLSAYLLRPLNAKEAPLNALLPRVMRRGNNRHPDLKSMSDALSDLYGAALYGTVVKHGEWHSFGLVSSFIDGNLRGVAELMCETLFEPVLGAYVEPERDNLINAIRSQKNDKMSYAIQRLDALACDGEPYTVGRFGGEEDALSITRDSLEAHYRNVLKSSRVELFYCGRENPEDAIKPFLPRFQALGHVNPEALPKTEPRTTLEKPRYFTEYEDVAQAKLAMMWRTGGFKTARDLIAARAAAAIYGGDAGKLFENVRERMSLCYFADAYIDRHKCVMKARSGVENTNIDKARDEMLAQWNAVVNGDFTEEDLTHAKASLSNAWASAGDSPAGLESFWQGQAASRFTESLDDWSNMLNTLGKQDVVEAAQRFSLDAVYCLRSEL